MFFDSISDLNTVIAYGRKTSTRFNDSHDPEVNRLFNFSPPMSDISSTYEFDSVFRNIGKDASAAVAQPAASDTKEASTKKISDRVEDKDGFKPVEVRPREAGAAPPASLLTAQLQSRPATSSTPQSSDKSKSKRIQLTIYLPDCSSIDITVNDTDNFGDVIKTTLFCHKDESRRPELHYHCPELYELRMHEGWYSVFYSYLYPYLYLSDSTSTSSCMRNFLLSLVCLLFILFSCRRW